MGNSRSAHPGEDVVLHHRHAEVVGLDHQFGVQQPAFASELKLRNEFPRKEFWIAIEVDGPKPRP